jgi:hypothetical protein
MVELSVLQQKFGTELSESSFATIVGLMCRPQNYLICSAV